MVLAAVLMLSVFASTSTLGGGDAEAKNARDEGEREPWWSLSRLLPAPILPIPTPSPGPGPQPVPDDCEVDELLVNPCRPWLGAAANGYPDVGTSRLRPQIEAHEERIDRPVDIVHTYAPVGSLPLRNADELHFANRDDTIVFQNWKPAGKWAHAAGGNAEIDAHIDAAADNIKAVAPARIFLTLHHEPENDVSSGTAGGCDTHASGASGSPPDYVAMWHNVRERFDAKGVDNVVWVMDYMNYPRWDCVAPKLYPGNDHVDWVMFNAYGSGENADFVRKIERFEPVLEQLKLGDKPLGIVEWGIELASQETVYAYYDGLREAIEAGELPQLKAYMIFDSPGPREQGGLRIAYDDSGSVDAEEVERYKALADTIAGE